MICRIYTDGSCNGNPGLGGWGAVIIEDEVLRTMRGNSKGQTTNNAMEIVAVIEAVRSIKEPATLFIYSDSQYVVRGLRRTITLKANKELWNELFSLLKHHSYQAEWVMGHSGHEYNEMADKLAKRVD